MNPCRLPRRWLAPGIVLFALWAALMWATAPQVPFHPDESTYLFTAQDGIEFWSRPWRLFYRGSGDRREHYRLVDPPLLRWYVGTVLGLLGLAPLPVDWDWGASWAVNQARGAVPDARLLATARQAVTLLVLLAAPGVALAACRLRGPLAGLLAGLYFMLHPLVWLHGRRVMMEGPLLFGVAWFLAALTAPRLRAWLLGLTLGLSLAAKQTALALFVPALWRVGKEMRPPRAAARGAVTVLALGLGVYFLLSPVFWNRPLAALQAARQRRLAVTLGQRRAFGQHAGAFVPRSIPQRVLLTGVLLFGPMQYAEVGNYQDVLAAQQAAYTRTWGWLHHPALQPVRLAWGLLGLWRLIRRRERAPALPAFLVGFGAVHGLLMLALPLAFQRYVVILVPWWAVAAGGVAWGQPSSNQNSGS